jgi:hypothetical protein
VSNQLIGASRGSSAVLECLVEAWPRPLTSWIRHDQTLLLPNHKYQITEQFEGYKVKMRLKLVDITEKDFGALKCVAKNTLGEKEGFIRLYETKVATPEQKNSPVEDSTIRPTESTKLIVGKKEERDKGSFDSAQQSQHPKKIIRVDAGDSSVFRWPNTSLGSRPMSSGCIPIAAISAITSWEVLYILCHFLIAFLTSRQTLLSTF